MKVFLLSFCVMMALGYATSQRLLGAVLGVPLEASAVVLCLYAGICARLKGPGLTPRVKQSLLEVLVTGGLFTLCVLAITAAMEEEHGAQIVMFLSSSSVVFVVGLFFLWRVTNSNIMNSKPSAGELEKHEAHWWARFCTYFALVMGTMGLLGILLFCVATAIHVMYFDLHQPLFGQRIEDKLTPLVAFLPGFIAMAAGQLVCLNLRQAERVLRQGYHSPPRLRIFSEGEESSV